MIALLGNPYERPNLDETLCEVIVNEMHCVSPFGRLQDRECLQQLIRLIGKSQIAADRKYAVVDHKHLKEL